MTRTRRVQASKNAAEVDKPIPGLLRDLKACGMLDETLVIWAAAFDPTPVSQGGDGRSHNPYADTIWMAGGRESASRRALRTERRT